MSRPRVSARRAAALALLVALAGAPPAAAVATRGYVLGSDYTTGTVSVIDLDTRALTRDVAVVSGDPVARWYAGRLYVVNRFGADNVQVIDPAQGHATTLQFSVGNGSNPQDIAFASPRKAYVSRLGDPGLLVVDPATGAALGTVSLARFADADGNPEASHLAVVGDLLFVALGRLTDFVPADSGLVAVVDTRADTLFDVDPSTPGTQAVRLHAANPWTDFARIPAASPGGDTRLLVGCIGRWGALDGGIEEIVVPPDAADGGALGGRGLIATESGLGGDVVDVVVDPAGRGYAVVSDAASSTRLLAWDAATGAAGATLFAPGGFSISDIQLDGRGGLWACRSDFAAPGLYLFAVPADTLLAGPLASGLPPVSIVFDEGGGDPPPVPRPGALALGAPWPNPAADRLRVTVELARDEVVDVGLYDLSGRRVLALGPRALPAGSTELSHRLAGPDGSDLTPGVYFVRARAGSSEARRRFVVVR